MGNENKTLSSQFNLNLLDNVDFLIEDEMVMRFKQYATAYNAYYYDKFRTMSDDRFDEIEDILTADLDINKLIIQEKTRLFELNKSSNNHVAVSLDKIKEDKKDPNRNIFFDLQQWWLTYNINYKKIDFFIGPKFDGGALKIELNYEQEIVKIITRGGVDYTEKLKQNTSIKSVLAKIKKSGKKYTIITGEMVVSKSLFAIKYDHETQEDEFSEFKKLKNPRNAVNSLIAGDNFDDLKFMPLTDGTNPIIVDGINIWTKVTANDLIKTLKDRYLHYRKGDFLIDGIVVAFNTKQRIIKNNFPLNMVALKFQNPGKPMRIIDIKYTQKKTGKLNPVVYVEPTMLDGALITKLTLYSYDQLVNKYKCGVGALIEVRKGDEITPKIFKTIEESDDYRIPENSIIVGKHIMYNADDEVKSLENDKQKFILGLKCLNLQGVGPKLSEEIGSDSAFNYNIVELFNPDKRQTLATILGPISANYNNIIKIYDIKNLQLNTLIEMLQFNGCGQVLSLKFAEMLTGMVEYSKSGIDENVFDYVISGDGRLKIAETIKQLKSYGVKVIKPISADSESITFEMTNNPPNMTKGEFKKIIASKYPNALHTTLTKNTKFLICDNVSGTTSKLNKARRYNVEIRTYSDILENGF